LRRLIVVGKPKFTRIPKIPDLVSQGVPTECISTYAALADHANNRTGMCWPKMETLAQTLKRSVRTIQRHLHLLRELGLIEFVERRRYKGRFSSYLYRVLHIVVTTGHGRRVKNERSIKSRTKPSKNIPGSSSKNVKEGYEWLFGDAGPPSTQNSPTLEASEKQKTDAHRRTEGYEWLFK
jgi:DNA-binding transcriptional ArsR family regulator